MRWAARPGVLAALVWCFLCLAGLYTAASTVPELRWLTDHFTHRVWGSVACVWALALAAAQGAFNRDLGVAWRLALVAMVAAALANAMGPNRAWLAGWLPALAGIGVIAVRARPRAALATALAVAVIVLWQLDRLLGLVAIGDNPYSLATRFDAALIVLRIAALRPLIGVGPANYYPATAAYEIRGHPVTFSSHNNYLDILAQTGMIGLLLFLAVFALALRRAWRLAAVAPPGFQRAFALGALGGLTGTLAAALLGDWVIPFVYNQTLMQLPSSTFAWIFLGAVLALRREE
jgi:O-antigen ligase